MTHPSSETILALIQKDISNIRTDVSEIKGHLENDYVSKVEFWPIKVLVYSFCSLILTAAVGALIKTIIIK